MGRTGRWTDNLCFKSEEDYKAWFQNSCIICQKAWDRYWRKHYSTYAERRYRCAIQRDIESQLWAAEHDARMLVPKRVYDISQKPRCPLLYDDAKREYNNHEFLKRVHEIMQGRRRCTTKREQKEIELIKNSKQKKRQS